MGHKQSLLLLSGKLLPADFAMSSGATFASALALSRVPQVKATFLFCPAVWKRFRGNRDRQVGGRRTGRNCFQNFRSKEREDRQPLKEARLRVSAWLVRRSAHLWPLALL